MKTQTKIWIGVAIVAVLIVMWIIGGYNTFVKLDQNINSKWSEVESQYQRQADLIPNLVSVVASAVGAETKFVKDVTAARTAWENSKTDTTGAQLTATTLTMINAVAENYPTLQANKQYVALTDELSGTQNRITVARGNYITAIQSYNTATKVFPSNILANIFGFSGKEYYQAKEGSMNTPSLGNATLP